MKRARILMTDGEVRAAGKNARAATKGGTIIVDARYAKRQDAIIIRLNTGSTVVVSRMCLCGFEHIAPVALRQPRIETTGNASWFESPDIGVGLDTLMIVAAGEDTVRAAARL